MSLIVKNCKIHGALVISEVNIRNKTNRMDCKHCTREYKIRARLQDPEKFKEHGIKYRYVTTSPEISSRYCSGCKKEILKEDFADYAWRLRHPRCRSCMSISNYKSKLKHKDTYEVYKIKASLSSRRSYLKKRWDLTLEQYDDLIKSQNSMCAICKKIVPVLHIDHDHKTNKVRQLLCNQCNRGIGYLQEDISILLSAIDYIKYHANPFA